MVKCGWEMEWRVELGCGGERRTLSWRGERVRGDVWRALL